MFVLLNKVCQENGFEVTEYWTKRDIQTRPQYALLESVIPEVNWKGTRLELLRRIQKIGKNKTLSCREKGLLKKLITENIKNGKCNYKAILYYFPGKTEAALKKEVAKGL